MHRWEYKFNGSLAIGGFGYYSLTISLPLATANGNITQIFNVFPSIMYSDNQSRPFTVTVSYISSTNVRLNIQNCSPNQLSIGNNCEICALIFGI